MKFRKYHSLADLPGTYRNFFAETARESFFFSLPWYENFCQSGLEPGADLHIYTVESASDPARPLVVLLARSPGGQGGSIFRGRPIKGLSLAALTSFQTTLFGVLTNCEPEMIKPALCILADGLSAEQPRWDIIDLNLLDCASPVYASLVEAFGASRLVTRTYRHNVTLYENVDGTSYQEYLKNRPSVLKNTLKRKRKRLEKLGQISVVITSTDAELDTQIRDYETVLAASWKEPETFPDFAEGLIRRSAEAGALRLGILYIDERPAATQLWILGGGRATIYKLHYDEEFKNQSVGTILTEELMKHVIDTDHVCEVDFGYGIESYKRLWLPQERQLCGVICFNALTVRGFLALIRYSFEELVTTGKSYLKRLLSPFLKLGSG